MKKEHLEGCYDAYGDCTCEEIHYKQIEETRHQQSLKEAFEKQSWELAQRIVELEDRIDWIHKQTRHEVEESKIFKKNKRLSQALRQIKEHCQDSIWRKVAEDALNEN